MIGAPLLCDLHWRAVSMIGCYVVGARDAYKLTTA